MNALQKIVEEEPLPSTITKDLLDNPMFTHRYYDDKGNLLPACELRRVEAIWAQLRNGPPPIKVRA